MAKYAIARMMKLKTTQDIAGAGAHVFRLRETPNADPSRRHLNRVLKNTATTNKTLLHQTVNERIEKAVTHPKARIRKNSVRAYEFVLTASPDFFNNATKDEIEEWHKKNLEFAEKELGKDNVVCAVAHYDEQTIHTHIFGTPITNDGRLSAKDFYGGSRQIMRDFQTRYAKHMESLGLKRGRENSKAKHTSISDYYKAVNEANTKFKPVKLKKPAFYEFKKVEKYTRSIEKELNRQRKKESSLAMEVKRTSRNAVLDENKKKSSENIKLKKELEKETEKRQQAETQADLLRIAKAKKEEEMEARLEKMMEQVKHLQEKNKRLTAKNSHSPGPR